MDVLTVHKDYIPTESKRLVASNSQRPDQFLRKTIREPVAGREQSHASFSSLLTNLSYKLVAIILNIKHFYVK